MVHDITTYGSFHTKYAVSSITPNSLPVVGFELGGSYAKGTWLPEKADIDIFVMFWNQISEKDFRNIGIKIGFESLRNTNHTLDMQSIRL